MITLNRSILTKKDTKKKVSNPYFVVDYPDFETFYLQYEKAKKLETSKNSESLKMK